MIFLRFALLTAAIAILLALMADVAVQIASTKLGGFGIMGRPWQWTVLLSAWLGLSLAIAIWCGGKLHIRPF